MRIRRKTRRKTAGSWTPERSAAAHAAKARKRMARAVAGESMPEPRRVPEGEPLGVLEWHAADGSVRRWAVRQGPRANNISVRAYLAGSDAAARVMGWDKFLAALRKRLAAPKRIFVANSNL